MATWNFRNDFPSDFATTDGTYFYILNGTSWKVIRYEEGTMTQTELLDIDNDRGAWQVSQDIVFFNNAIYIWYVQSLPVAPDFESQIKVERYDLDLETWSVVIDVTQGADRTASGLLVNQTGIGFYIQGIFGGTIPSNNRLFVSGDGITWSEVDPPFSPDQSDEDTELIRTSRGRLYHSLDSIWNEVARFEEDYFGSDIFLGRWHGGVLTRLAVSNPEMYLFSDSRFHWRLNGSTYQYSTDLTNWSTPTDSAIVPIREINMPYPVGYKQIGTEAYIYYWFNDVDQWDDPDLVIQGISSVGQIRQCIRLDNGDTFVRTSRDGALIWYGKPTPIEENFPSGGGDILPPILVAKSEDDGDTWEIVATTDDWGPGHISGLRLARNKLYAALDDGN
jgi:hypothetical protein